MSKSVENKLSIHTIKWDKINLQFSLSKSFPGLENPFKLLIRTRNANKEKVLNYKLKSYSNHYTILVPRQQLERLEIGKWDFYIEVNSEKESRKIRLGLYNAPITSQKMRYLDPVSGGKYSFSPFLTEKNGLSIHSGNLMYLDDKRYNVVSISMAVQNIEETEKSLNIKLVEKVKLLGKKSQLIFKSGDNVCAVPLKNYEDSNFINVEKKDIAKIYKNKRWNVYIQNIKGNVLERISLNISIKIRGGNLVFSKKMLDKIETTRPRQYVKGQINADNFRVINDYIVFEMDPNDLKYADKVKFYIKKRKENDKNYVETVRTLIKGKEQIKIPISQFVSQINNSGRWDLSVELFHKHVKERRRVGFFNWRTLSNKEKICGYLPYCEELGVSPYITKDNEFSFYFCTEEQYINSLYPASSALHHLSMNKSGIMRLRASVYVDDTTDFCVDHIALRCRHNKSEIIKIPCTPLETKEKRARKIVAEVNLKNLELEQFYWDFYIVITLENKKQRFVRLQNDHLLINKKLKHRQFKYSLKMENDYVLYPYITANNCLSITYRQIGEYESFKYKFNEYAAYVFYLMIFWFLKRNPIWLIHEKYSETAQDNSFYFFKHCYENHYDKKVFFVIKKGSPDEANLYPYRDRVVYFMSIKHLILLLVSKLIVSSESKGHGYAWRVSKGVINDYLKEKKYIFLQHGVLGLKRVDNTFKANTANGADLFVVSSDFERDIVHDYFGYDKRQIIVTGLSRWDAVEDRSKQSGRKEVFLMPTWRNWLEEVEEDQFLMSDYYHEYNSLLNSERLSKLLRDNDIMLNFYVHPKFMPYVSSFTSSHDYINVIQFGEEKINDLIMRSSLLITDYSSVAWEAYYQEKPILFFHFDVEKYIETQGSYMDLEKDIFGDIAYNSTELVEKLAYYINNSFAEKKEFSKKRNSYFKYIDGNNSSRIFNKIIDHEKNLTSPERSQKLLRLLKKNHIVRVLWRKSKKFHLVERIGRQLLIRLTNPSIHN